MADIAELNEWAEGCKAVSVEWQEQVLQCTDGYDRECGPSERYGEGGREQ